MNSQTNLSHNVIKGLQIFINDIRKCETREAEEDRVEKELEKVRKQFASGKTLTGYDKKKNIWKLCYVYVLGYKVDFGLNFCLDLITSIKYSEKLTGYLSLSIFLRKESIELKNMFNCVRNDLIETSSLRQCLALTLASNLPNTEMLELIANDAAKFMTNFREKKPDSVKLSLIVLSKIVSANPAFHSAESFAEALEPMIEMKYFSVMQGLAALVLHNVKQFGGEGYEEVVNKLFNNIIFKLKDCPVSYIYHRVKAPWLQIKVLKLLQQVDPECLTDETIKNINEYFGYISKKVKTTLFSEVKVPRIYSEYSIFFECINLIDHLGPRVQLLIFDMFIDLLSKMLDSEKKRTPNKDVNTKYLSLESLAKLVKFSSPNKLMEMHSNTIYESLRDSDISIRRRALDLLYLLCRPETVKRVCYELICYLKENEPQLKTDVQLKLSILAEKYGNDYFWYVDTTIKTILLAGETISDDIIFRFVQVIVGFENQQTDEAIQKYAAERCLKLLESNYLFEQTVDLCATIMGEFGHLLGSTGKSISEIVDLITKHLPNLTSKGVLSVFNSLMKLLARDESISKTVLEVLSRYRESWDPEIQQRSLEFSVFCGNSINNIIEIRQKLFGPMSLFTSDLFNNSLLVKRLEGNKKQEVPKKSRDEENESSYVDKSSILYEKDKLGFSEVQNVQYDDSQLLRKEDAASNFDFFRSMLTKPFNGEGTIYSDNQIRVTMKIVPLKGGEVGAVLMFQTDKMELSDIKISHSSQNNLTVLISNVKYGDQEGPQVLIKFKMNQSYSNPPILSISALAGSVQINIDFAVPILVHKFLDNEVDINPQEFGKKWIALSKKGELKSLKFDTIMRNPMKGAILDGFLAKFSGLLESLGFKVFVFERSVQAVSKLSEDNDQIILIEASFVEDYDEEFRFSVRSNTQFKQMPFHIFSIVKFFINPS